MSWQCQKNQFLLEYLHLVDIISIKAQSTITFKF